MAILVCIALAVAATLAGITWTPLAFLAVPFLLVAAYALWLGLGADELLDTLESDPGSGPAGLH